MGNSGSGPDRPMEDKDKWCGSGIQRTNMLDLVSNVMQAVRIWTSEHVTKQFSNCWLS